MNALEIRNLNVWYGKFHALKGVSLIVPEGVIAGLLGPNGAGKTTLIKSIMNLLPYEGEINIFRKQRIHIGYLSEDEGYYDHLTGYEYLNYFARIFGLKNARDKIISVVKTVGLEGRENDLVKSYSKGMKRRLGIARTLLINSPLIILDEPMSGLDPKIKSDLRRILSSISKEKTIIISSHQLRDIEDICDWLIMIDQGKIIDYGKPESILKKLKPQRSITLLVNNITEENLKDLKNIEGVININCRKNTLEIVYSGIDDSVIFEYFVSNNIKFRLKSDSLESIYREVYK